MKRITSCSDAFSNTTTTTSDKKMWPLSSTDPYPFLFYVKSLPFTFIPLQTELVGIFFTHTLLHILEIFTLLLWRGGKNDIADSLCTYLGVKKEIPFLILTSRNGDDDDDGVGCKLKFSFSFVPVVSESVFLTDGTYWSARRSAGVLYGDMEIDYRKLFILFSLFFSIFLLIYSKGWV